MSGPSHGELARAAAEAMRANGRVPEMNVLECLPDEWLQAIIDKHTA